jgi:hypothetical protein
VTLEQVDRALRELTNGEVNKLAGGDDTEALALDVLKTATKAKNRKRALAAEKLLSWVLIAGCAAGKRRGAFTLYALAGYSSQAEIEARLREEVARYEPDLRALADS